MKRYFIFYLIGVCLILLSACGKVESLPSPERTNNEHLVFPHAKELFITTEPGDFKFPNFILDQLPTTPVFIAVFDQEIRLNSDKSEISNSESIIWQWSGTINNVPQLMTYEDGIGGSMPLTSLSCLYASSPERTYYWVAWTWDDQENFIEYATRIHPFKLEKTTKGIRLEKLVITEDETMDEFINSGEEITVDFFLENEGEDPIKNLVASFQNSSISEFPLSVNIGNVNPGETVIQTVTFHAPLGLEFESQFNIEIVLSGDDCFLDITSGKMLINGRTPCLIGIALDSIPPLDPNGNFWDTCSDGTECPPDIIFSLLEGANIIIPISDAIRDWPPAYWTIPSCIALDVRRTYSINFREVDNLWENPQTIGTAELPIISYMKTGDAIISIESGGVKVRFFVNWE